MDRFDEMRARGVGTGTGGGTSETTGIIPLPVPYMRLQSSKTVRGVQNIEVAFPDNATSIDVYLKEGNYPQATNDVYYHKETFERNDSSIMSRNITINPKEDGSYPYKLYGWAVSKNANGVQTAIDSGNRAEFNVYFASGAWTLLSLFTSITSYTDNTDVTIDGDLAFINTCAGLFVLDLTNNFIQKIANGNITEKPKVYQPRANVFLIKAVNWYEYKRGDTKTLSGLGNLGQNDIVGEYGGYYFFNANINYKKSTGKITTSCTNSQGHFAVTADGAFCCTDPNTFIGRLNLNTMTYEDVGNYYNENNELVHINIGASSVVNNIKITDCNSSNYTFLLCKFKASSSASSVSYAGFYYNGRNFTPFDVGDLTWEQVYESIYIKYDICGLGTNLIVAKRSNTILGLYKATQNGFIKVATYGYAGSEFAKTMDKRIVSLATTTGRCDLIISENKLYEYRYNKETNIIYSGTNNFYYGSGSSDTTHSTTSGSSLSLNAWNYLGYHNGKHWRCNSSSIYYLRDDGYWQRIIYFGGINAGIATYNGNYMYLKVKNTQMQIFKIKLETNGTVERINTPMTNNYDNIDIKEINGLIYIIPRVDRKTTTAYTNYADFVSVYDSATGTLTKSNKLRGGIPFGRNKYLSLSGLQISDLETGEIEEVPEFESTRIITDNLYEYTELYNGLSFVIYFNSAKGEITLMYTN